MNNEAGLTLEKRIQELITLVDKKFDELGQASLLNNKHFEVDKNLQLNNYLKFNRTSYSSSEIELSFEITCEGVSFYIGKTSEIPEWDYDTIIHDPKLFEEVIGDIFTCYILIESKGSKKTLHLFNKSGTEQRTFKYYNGINLNFLANTERKLYKPVFSMGN